MIASSAAPSFFCSSASTCLRPGPWQASQVMPRMSPFVSNTPDAVDAVLWQAKHRRASASGMGRAIASARSLGALIARAGVKSRSVAGEVAQPRLLEHAVLLEQVRLAHLARPEGPGEGSGGRGPVGRGDAEDATAGAGLDLVGVGLGAEAQGRVVAQGRRIRGLHGRLRHGRARLRLRVRHVTARAGGGTEEVLPGRRGLGRPEARALDAVRGRHLRPGRGRGREDGRARHHQGAVGHGRGEAAGRPTAGADVPVPCSRTRIRLAAPAGNTSRSPPGQATSMRS